MTGKRLMPSQVTVSAGRNPSMDQNQKKMNNPPNQGTSKKEHNLQWEPRREPQGKRQEKRQKDHSLGHENPTTPTQTQSDEKNNRDAITAQSKV
ncbi:hypothetical protein Tco_0374756 [Tanacetum coccineum]